jgi:hypothetical protein
MMGVPLTADARTARAAQESSPRPLGGSPDFPPPVSRLSCWADADGMAAVQYRPHGSPTLP